MKTYTKRCTELRVNGGILKDKFCTHYYKPGCILHREDGPAIECDNGVKSWWYNNKWIMRTEGDVTPKQLLEFLLRIL